MKKRGHGSGRWNGTGGKPIEEESLEETAIRETKEEIKVDIEKIKQMAKLTFIDLPTKKSHTAYAFLAIKWRGEPTETEEMKPKWFNISSLPYDQMWAADKIWIPMVLEGKKIDAVFKYLEGDILDSYKIEEY